MIVSLLHHVVPPLQVRRIKDQKVYAMKRMELTGLRPKQLASILNEAQVLSNLDHPRIVKTFEAWMGTS
jgi:serine/threonine protein kinase